MSQEPWPEWSGLNQPFDQSLPLEQYVDSALKVLRHVWLSGERKSPTHLANLMTGSDCILVIGAIQALQEELRSRSSMAEQPSVERQDAGSVPAVTATEQSPPAEAVLASELVPVVQAELLPCANCGTAAELQYHCGVRYGQCTNEDCEIQGPLAWTDEEARFGWNEQVERDRLAHTPDDTPPLAIPADDDE